MCRALTLAALLPSVSLVAAQGDEHSPRPGDGLTTRRSFPLTSFVAIGDYGSTSDGSFAVAARVRALDPRFVITLGDNNYPDGEASTIDENIGQHYHEFIHPYTGSYGPGAVVPRFFPTLGNHDWREPDAQPYLDYFVLPGNERYYHVRRDAVHFFALDSDPKEPDGIAVDSVQARWLESELARSDAPFKVVYMHHAPHCSSARHGSHGQLHWPFERWGASIVLTGHDHLYERLNVSGFPYVVNGLGGRSRYEFGPPVGGSELRFNADDALLLAEADAEFARFRLVTAGDVVADDFTLPSGGLGREIARLVPEDALWKYLDTGVDPGPGWKRRGFDDASWASGRAQLGYGDGDEATVVGYGADPGERFITTWFRSTFVVPDASAFASLQLRLLQDDGAIVYLNGREVARANLPSGAVTASTLATDGLSRTDERTFTPYDVPTELLIELAPRMVSSGVNVLAAEVHQASPGSNDLSFAAELIGLSTGTLLVPRGSEWRYLDTGIDPEPTWMQGHFDDSAWPIARAPLGHGEGDEATRMTAGPVTAWFRTRFQATEASSVRWLSCWFLRDDGAAIYLNGQELARFNLPRTGLGPGTPAAFEVTGADENVFLSTSLDPRPLVEGENTLAVEVHQSRIGGDDLSFDLELAAHRGQGP